ncbi:nicotinate (nicotinamide) nucleotide adenylyltransferase [Psychroflexus montanilacus]|uniref:nicotinate (nicotinamide) nucleotide adenylyltransferase n=1 Tax=Psychroflexus montanilacus TaxID=2873598 RepID=UPI001CCFF771|nr:nicotinate (nicotinamide) nucleotide adenylyltransferase [Psychroflexus montanilacus]MBZ9652616.1 nicotinate-nucleotide adenylyltransferase [Psychroflexus montanilacus]
MKKVGLYFGTFNPFHIGHLIIANHLAEHTDLDEIWLVITPQSPFKKKKNLLENHHRFELVYRATEAYDKLKPSDVEFKLPQPNYTSKTLAELKDSHPSLSFSLIMGEDNLVNFHKWKNYENILEEHDIYVCPRQTKMEIPERFQDHPKIHKTDTPIMEISSTLIRNMIKSGKNVEPLLQHKVWEYIDEMNFYR